MSNLGRAAATFAGAAAAAGLMAAAIPGLATTFPTDALSKASLAIPPSVLTILIAVLSLIPRASLED